MIPLEQGSVFRLSNREEKIARMGLNPFGTGQCLPTFILFSNIR